MAKIEDSDWMDIAEDWLPCVNCRRRPVLVPLHLERHRVWICSDCWAMLVRRSAETAEMYAAVHEVIDGKELR